MPEIWFAYASILNAVEIILLKLKHTSHNVGTPGRDRVATRVQATQAQSPTNIPRNTKPVCKISSDKAGNHNYYYERNGNETIILNVLDMKLEP